MDSIKDRLPASITTDRLVLTTPTLAHVPDIARLANNQRIYEVMARLPFPYTEADARFFVEEIVPSQDETCYAITRDGVFMGIVGLTYHGDSAPQLGYWLGEEYWGRGFATEAACAVVAAAKAAGVPALRSRALVGNAGSRNVLRKTGFAEIAHETETINNLAGRQLVLMHLELDR
ncbi:GNAT family N-acetyltransferase [Devosia oryziradicis]|uniref:GNAT family N-acetyltransferase n=1 Tax=Devosia oryziradicis TaxID=2801335 RepID=A0ABX7C3Y2_9HYPH|nr:GNAT family N-acetyltransferase [Devosia oryziradicis]QQR36731.1 GNAT family N-acetyltransferase [Devosia oryziradicis]